MSLFDAMGNAPMNLQQMLQQIRSNPAQMLRQRGLNIPANMNDPRQMVQHLIQSGQIPNTRLQRVMQLMGRR